MGETLINQLLQKSEDIKLAITIVSAIVAIISIYIAVLAKRTAHQATTGTILLQLRQIYSTKEMSQAVHYLMNLKRKYEEDRSDNPYCFAREYLNTISPTSEEWEMRRIVSHFYTHLASLIIEGVLDEDAVFSIWGSNQFEIIEFLEPIETLIAEKYYSLLYDTEWKALRLLHRGKRWQKSRKRKINPRFTLPRNKKLYEESLIVK